MSRQTISLPPVAAFVDPAAESWGVAIGDEPATVSTGSLRAGSEGDPDGPATAPIPGAVRAGLAPGEWTLQSEDGSVRITATPANDGARSGEEALELSLAEGVLAGAAGAEEEVHGGAMRHPGGVAGKLESARLLIAWFPEGRAMALLAARPRSAKGQDRDALTVACLGVREGLSVFDPRLSSTYNGEGGLRRVGVELWLGETEDGDQVPFRVAGEALGPKVTPAGLGLSLEAQPLRCHSRGQEGIGIYLLIRGDD